MIKHYKELTSEDKQKLYEQIKISYSLQSGKSWDHIEPKIQNDLDCTFCDELFVKMDPDSLIDAAYCRKEFGKNKPDIIDYLIWMKRFVTHSDYIDI